MEAHPWQSDAQHLVCDETATWEVRPKDYQGPCAGVDTAGSGVHDADRCEK
jgi:hypothetical protein